MKYLLVRKYLIVILMLLSGWCFSQALPERPNPPVLVNDYASFLQANEKNQLEQMLSEFALRTSTQIAIVVVSDLDGYDVGDYAIKLAQKWGIGQKDKDNGLLILVKPKKDNEQGKVFIATGYGLEDVIPDVVCKRIIENEIIPRFKEGLFAQGLMDASQTLMALAESKFTAEDYMNRKQQAPPASVAFFLFVFIFFVIIMIGKVNQVKRKGIGGHPVSFLTAMFLLSAASGQHRGSYSNFSSGRGGFSSGGGFGGGGFGGGGAGGSW
jgi:uncharacterized protein